MTLNSNRKEDLYSLPHHQIDQGLSVSRIIDNIGASAKYLIIFVFSLIVLNTPNSWLPIYYAAMSFVSGLICKTLKQTIRQPRPKLSPETGFGMPSSHAQAFFYLLTVLVHKWIILVDANYINAHPWQYNLSLGFCSTFGIYCVTAR